jgi:hypothetical protein
VPCSLALELPIGCRLLRVAGLYLAAPGTCFLVAAFDQVLEPLEVTVHLGFDDAEQIACDVLRGRVALGVNLKVDASQARTEPLERDDAVVLDLAVDRLPGDSFVRLLFGDLRGPLVAARLESRPPT